MPRIKVFFPAKGMTCVPPEVIDLARPRVTEKIVSREDAEKWGIKELKKFWVAWFPPPDSPARPAPLYGRYHTFLVKA
jgi:hypothetical protein